MSDPWLHIVGIGENGAEGISGPARAALDAADIIFGAERHLELAAVGKRGRLWPVPFSIEPLAGRQGKPTVALVSGDPFWHGAGSLIARRFGAGEWTAYPSPSTFSLAASRLGWPLEETVTMGLHAAPLSRLKPVLSQGVRAILLLRDGPAVASLAGWLESNGLGASAIHVLEALGGPQERIRQCTASSFNLADIASPVAVAVEAMGAGISRASGLPDELFEHDGQLTKRPVRALTLSALAPRPGEILWDVGAGSGSISIEFLLAAPATRAFAVEANPERAEKIRRNAASFGLENRLDVCLGRAPAALEGLPDPHVVFVGGGTSQELLEAIWGRVASDTRLVVNAVTIESEALLADWSNRFGGSMLRIEIAMAGILGSRRGWRPSMPVVQWSARR